MKCFVKRFCYITPVAQKFHLSIQEEKILTKIRFRKLILLEVNRFSEPEIIYFSQLY